MRSCLRSGARRKDMRVLAFEDRHDASHCMAVLKQWPEYDWCDLSVSMLPTDRLEQDLLAAWKVEVRSGVSRNTLCLYRWEMFWA
eukprot:363937-Chlamydomonas_euryale.AAC.16